MNTAARFITLIILCTHVGMVLQHNLVRNDKDVWIGWGGWVVSSVIRKLR